MRTTYEAYVGIADANGIESFIPNAEITPHALTFMQMRVQINSLRNGLIYRVFVTPEVANTIRYLLDKVGNKQALVYMKKHAAVVEAVGSRGQDIWDSIPHWTTKELEEMHGKKKENEVQQMKLELDDDHDNW